MIFFPLTQNDVFLLLGLRNEINELREVVNGLKEEIDGLSDTIGKFEQENER